MKQERRKIMTALIMSSLLSLGFCGAPAHAAVTAESSSGTVTGNEDTGTVNGNTLNIVSGTTVGSAVAGKYDNNSRIRYDRQHFRRQRIREYDCRYRRNSQFSGCGRTVA